ncbi:hypothetical protein E1295_41565 [Nonomuraea mesophila]|uniref:Sensor domain-containing protein n=1 Tax=Nonomuraea mesophila TaxID=2530382 RepID=A0A4R5EAY1_9ACTN|nr:hypothetical protein [Nonomuraea mesophila]TDE29632.1 hypothetical protein E1295_41565 [Nonomuraea mesophila]
MRREPWIIGCGLLACVVAGCGGGTAGSRLDPGAMAELREVLSEEPRLPDGFTPRPGEAWRIPFDKAGKHCRTMLRPAEGRAPRQALTAQAAVSYTGDNLGEQAGVALARYTGGGAADHLDDLADALESCRRVRSPSGTDLRSHELPIEDVGDEVVGARLSGRLNGYPYAMDVVLSRAGDTLVSVVHTGMEYVDAGRTRAMVDAAITMAEDR